ncbi:MAG: TetR/AcrR family transcriptional regulator [Acidobacteria bacterium]|nr:TetR/AcrR family transcriptional regulator [Acidobacteriota bacterium]
MGVSDRRTRHRVNLRREILDAASQLFVEEGYQRVTMRRIAERIEYSPTTIYLYFKDKAELFQAICEETFSQLTGTLERLEAAPGTPLAHLREGLQTYIDFGLQHPAHYAATFLRTTKGGEASHYDGSIGARAVDTLRQRAAACVESGDIHTTNIDMTTQALWASIHGLTALLTTEHGFPFVAPKVLIDHLLDVLIAGLRSQIAAPRTSPPRPAHTPKPFSFID